MSRKAVSFVKSAMDILRLCTFASPLATCRHALKNIKEYLLGQVKLSQIYPMAVNCIRDDIYLSCLSNIHRS